MAVGCNPAQDVDVCWRLCPLFCVFFYPYLIDLFSVVSGCLDYGLGDQGNVV